MGPRPWPREGEEMEADAVQQENDARLAELKRQTDAAIEAARKALEQAGGGE